MRPNQLRTRVTVATLGTLGSHKSSVGFRGGRGRFYRFASLLEGSFSIRRGEFRFADGACRGPSFASMVVPEHTIAFAAGHSIPMDLARDERAFFSSDGEVLPRSPADSM